MNLTSWVASGNSKIPSVGQPGCDREGITFGQKFFLLSSINPKLFDNRRVLSSFGLSLSSLELDEPRATGSTDAVPLYVISRSQIESCLSFNVFNWRLESEDRISCFLL